MNFVSTCVLTAGALFPAFAWAQTTEIRYPDHSKLLVLRDAHGNETPVTNADQWSQRAAHIRAGFNCHGPLPDATKKVPLNVERVSEEDQANIH